MKEIAQLVNVSTETDAAPEGKSVWVAEMYGHALGAAHLGLRYRGFNDTNHHPPGDPIQRARLLCLDRPYAPEEQAHTRVLYMTAVAAR